MNIKRLPWLALGCALVLAGAWSGRAAWRAHKNLVTLDVRNVPLRDVVRSLERQTRETVHLDKRLEGNITLKLKNVPLTEALERVAEEVGARAQTVHAVHRSDFALKQLKSALSDGGKIGSVGWTNLAPRATDGGNFGDVALNSLPELDNLLKPGRGQMPGGATSLTSGPVTIKMSGSDLNGEQMEAEIRKQLSAQGLDKLIPEGAIVGALQQAKAGSNGTALAGSPRVRVMTMGPDGKLTSSDGAALPPEVRDAIAGATNGFASGSASVRMGAPIISVKRAGPNGTLETVDTDLLAPERIVIESALDEKFPGEAPSTPTRAAAEAAARRVKGRCTTFYALQHSDLPILIGRTFKGIPGRALSFGTNGTSLSPAALAEQLGQEIQREKAEQYQTLTPEQRARRAREHTALSRQANP